MRPFILGAAALFLTVANAARDIVLFGDSLSDNGQGYAGNVKLVLQTEEVYPQRPYYEGRWQDGPAWIEHAAKRLDSRLFDYGSGGATTGSIPAQVPPLPVGFAGLTLPTTVLSPNLFQQINSHLLATNGTLRAAPVYIIFLGINSYFSRAFANTTVTFEPVTQSINRALDLLYSKGAREFIIPILPQISALPVFNHPELYGTYPTSVVDGINQQIDAQNDFHRQLVTSFPRNHPGARVINYDWSAALISVVTNARDYGITNLADACYISRVPANQLPRPTSQPIGLGGGQLCSDPANHLFFDQFHASAVAHRAIGDNFANALGASVFGVRGGGPAGGPARAAAPARGPVRGPATVRPTTRPAPARAPAARTPPRPAPVRAPTTARPTTRPAPARAPGSPVLRAAPARAPIGPPTTG